MRCLAVDIGVWCVSLSPMFVINLKKLTKTCVYTYASACALCGKNSLGSLPTSPTKELVWRAHTHTPRISTKTLPILMTFFSVIWPGQGSLKHS